MSSKRNADESDGSFKDVLVCSANARKSSTAVTLLGSAFNVAVEMDTCRPESARKLLKTTFNRSRMPPPIRRRLDPPPLLAAAEPELVSGAAFAGGDPSLMVP